MWAKVDLHSLKHACPLILIPFNFAINFILFYFNPPPPIKGWGEPTCTLVPWRQGFRHPTRNECMGWYAQIAIKLAKDCS